MISCYIFNGDCNNIIEITKFCCDNCAYAYLWNCLKSEINIMQTSFFYGTVICSWLFFYENHNIVALSCVFPTIQDPSSEVWKHNSYWKYKISKFCKIVIFLASCLDLQSSINYASDYYISYSLKYWNVHNSET